MFDLDRVEVINKVKTIVEREFENKRREGTLSLAHDLSHIYSVANASQLIARYFARREGYENIEEDVAYLSYLAGLLHDIRREKSEEVSHGNLGSDYVLNNKELRCIISQDEIEILARVIREHEKSYSEILRIFSSNPTESIVARSLAIGDKLFEASGPRGLERRSFFVGRERILEGDLNGKFRFPDESYLAVLGETLRRLYKINHARNYPEELRAFVDELHSWQYEFYVGLLSKGNFSSEEEAYNYFYKIRFPRIKDVENKIKENHLSGKYFTKDEFPKIARTIIEVRNANRKRIGEDAYRLVYEIATSETPDEFVENVIDMLPEGYYGKWVNGIVDYRKGIFFEELKDRLL